MQIVIQEGVFVIVFDKSRLENKGEHHLHSQCLEKASSRVSKDCLHE